MHRQRTTAKIMITVPESLASSLHRDGDTFRDWIATFPARARGYLDRWSCQLDGEIRAGAVAVVIPVQSPYGPAVIKISSPHPGNREEHRALRLWNGDGAVTLLDGDPAGFALLLERVHDRQLDIPPDEGIALGGQVAARLAVVAPTDMPRLADTTAEWEQQVLDDQRQTDHVLPARVLGAAIETIRDLGHDTTSTMLHGDLHAGNLLHSNRGWVVIDPKGMAGTAAYDAVTMCSYRFPPSCSAVDQVGEARRRIEIYSEAAGVDPDLSRRCVQARSVTGLLWDLSRGDVPRLGNFVIRMQLSAGLLR